MEVVVHRDSAMRLTHTAVVEGIDSLSLRTVVAAEIVPVLALIFNTLGCVSDSLLNSV
jgi:hypothetical protein